MSKKGIVACLLTLALILGIVVLHRNYYGQEFGKTHSEVKAKDFSWLYGTWQLTIDGETHTICFLSNGSCIENFKSRYGRQQNEAGSYTVEKNRIRIDCGDGYPSYIERKGKLLYEDGKSYRKID